MLKKNAQWFEGLFTVSDLVFVSLAWIMSYWIRFSSGFIPVDKGVPPLSDYLRVLIFVWLIWAFVFRRFGLYRPMRGSSRLREVFALVRANAFAVILFLAVTYLFREKSVPFSRGVFLIFWLLATALTVSSRTAVRQLLRLMRKRGFNLRYILVVGAGSLAAKVCRRIRTQPEFGIQLLGCLANEAQVAARKVGNAPNVRAATLPAVPPIERGLRVIGSYSDLPRLLEQGGIDQIVVALPLSDHDQMEGVIESIGDSMVDIKIVPDFHQFIKLGSLVEEFDGLPVMSLASTPLQGFNRVTKRILDIILGTFFLVLAVPIMLLAALLVRLSSPGPIFYSQERVGLDGRSFRIYKFRTMRIDAEKQGAKWTTEGDPRVTLVGKWLRRLSIDELPQLINVIRGEMSLVGPRPERPVFISEFRGRIPHYMLRHKVQAGMTGWAQVHGWRGNTSIERRIEHDLYYIENWSLGLDLKIIGMTLVHSFRDRNAY